MQIPSDLPQFEDETTLIIVTGRQAAVFYRAHHGLIDRLDAFKTPNPHYSDREGSGTVGELDTESVIRDFLHEFKQRLKKLPECTSLFIFAPEQIKNKIGPALPTTWRRKIKGWVEGNYYYRHPLYLLKRITLNAPSLSNNK